MTQVTVFQENNHFLNIFFQEAMSVVHISKEDQQNVFSILAAVLWLGNINFTVIDNENHVEVMHDEGDTFEKIYCK